jgi:hypothetical protein
MAVVADLYLNDGCARWGPRVICINKSLDLPLHAVLRSTALWGIKAGIIYKSHQHSQIYSFTCRAPNVESHLLLYLLQNVPEGVTHLHQ